MKLTRIEQNEDKTYSLYFDEDFYKYFTKYYKKDSYFNILYRIFGLLPQDFYHYIGATFGAQFKPSPLLHNFIYTFFIDKQNAIAFANEVDRRLTYIIKREDFD